MRDIIIFGTGEFAEVASYYFSHDSEYRVVAFAVDQLTPGEEVFAGYPVVTFSEIEKYFPPSQCDIFIAIAYKALNKSRANKCIEAEQKGYNLASFVSTKTNASSNVVIGKHCFIFEGNTIQPFTKISDNVIIWSGNHIGHHCIIGNHSFITSHVCIGGRSKIGNFCFLGMNSTIRDGISVADECLIGAGALILKDTKPKQVYSVKGTLARELLSDQIDF